MTINGGIFNLNGNTQTVGALSGAGGTIGWAPARSRPTAPNTTWRAQITGTGGLTKQGLGTLNLTGTNTYTGPTSVMAGTLAVNGSLTSNVTVGAAGTLGGNGTITGLVTNNGIIAPGNSIGTLTINGNFVQSAGSIYQVQVNPAGQGDRINSSGTATLNGGMVQVQAQSGTYARNTTYTILNAAGGVSGAYSSVTSNFAFLTPSLSYDANNVYLLLFQNQGAFAAGAQTPNQYAVGTVLDRVNATATGDLNNVLNALSLLSNTQGPAALNAISGQPWADFGTMNINNAALFMNTLGQQMANARGGAASAGQRQALAQACEIAACDGTGPLSAWGSALGGLGSVLGDSNTGTLTYNSPAPPPASTTGSTRASWSASVSAIRMAREWVNSFPGQGWSDSVSVAAYGSFTQSGFYVDGLAGYAYYNNQLRRQILIPGLEPAHRHRQHRRQPVPRPDRGRIQGRHLCTRRRDHHAVRPLPDLERDAEWLLRVGRQLAQSQRGAADDQLAAHHHRCRSGGRHRHRRRQEARSRFQAGLDARVCRYRPADHRGLWRRTGEHLHRVRRPAGAQSAVLGLLGHGQHRHGDAALPALRRRDRHGTDNHAINLGVRFYW